MKKNFNLNLLGVTVRVSAKQSRNGLQWYYRFIYPPRRGGKNHKGVLGPVHLLTKTMIQDALLRIIRDAQCEPPPKKEILSTLIDLFMKRHGNHLSSQGQREKQALDHFLKYAGDRHIDEITVGFVEDFMTERLRTVEPSTVNRDMVALKSAFNKAIRWGLIQLNPAKGISKLKEAPGRVRYLVGDEWVRLKNAAEQGPPWLYPACVLAREAGLRQGEIIHLKWSDVDLSRNLIRIHNSKGNRIEIIPINRAVQEVLWNLPRESQLMLVTELGNPLYRLLIDRAWRRARKKAKIEDLRFHDLRHDFGSRIVMAGKGIEAAMALLRHRDLRMTMRYSHLSPQYLRDTVEAIVNDSPPSELPVVPRLSQLPGQSQKSQCPQRDSNPCYSLERAVS